MLCGLQVKARLLPPPALVYDKPMNVGGLGWDMRSSHFHKPAVMASYGIASFADFRRCGRGLQDEGSLEVRLE
jgi:hypothetical protein